MPDSDFYSVLGVSKSASQDEIRKAYRKLARQYHPDVKPDDPESAEKFKQVQEAYNVIGDAEKRQKYDRFGSAYKYADAAGAGPGGPQYQWAGPGTGPIDIEELFGGVDLGDLFGGGRGPGRSSGRARPRRGEDLKTEILVSFETAALGGQHELQYRVDGEPKHISVKIPAGVNPGGQIRLAGQGNPGLGGGPSGDLLITVNVAPHAWFKREGNRILLDLPLTPAEAALGTKVEVPTLEDGKVLLTVPPGTSSGMKLRLKDKGIVDPKTRQRGDLFATVRIMVPKSLSDAERELYQQLAAARSDNPRAPLWN